MTNVHPHFHRRAEDDLPEVLPQGVTEEQLAFFTEQTERAVAKKLRAYRASAILGFIVLTVGLILALHEAGRIGDSSREAVVKSGRAVAVEGCNRDFIRDTKFRNLLNRLKAASEASRTSTPAQRQMALDFYDQELESFTLPDCRRSESLLTDDPTQKIPVVAPYFPGGPNIEAGPRLPQNDDGG